MTIHNTIKMAQSKSFLLSQVAVSASILICAIANAQDTVLNYEPANVTVNGSQDCYDCHEHAVDAWKESTHSRTYQEMHLRDEAKGILERIGMSGSIKRSKECTQCHYTGTSKEIGARMKTIAGVSCQRCHGPANQWIVPHQDESMPDRLERLTAAMKLGMRPTVKIYDLARNCFQCHTVPREKLVNMGEHPAGSDEFELVAWSQGEVLHNYLAPTDDPNFRQDGDVNHPATTERKRLLYIMGLSIDLEFSLRSLAIATEDGEFLDSMSDRVQTKYDKLKALGLGIAEIDEMVALLPMEGGSLKLIKSNRDEYLAVADKIGALAQTLETKSADYATSLAKLDSMLPTEYRGDMIE